MRTQRLTWVGLAFFVVGVASIAVGLMQSFGPFLLGVGDAETYEVPGAFEADLEPGVYTLFLRTTNTSQVGIVRLEETERFEIRSVSIRDPRGTPVPFESSINTTLQRGNEGYQSVVEFSAEFAGFYSFDVQTSAPTEALVYTSIAAVFRDGWPWAMLAVVGGLVGAMGVVMIGLAFARRPTKSERALQSERAMQEQPQLNQPPPAP